MTTPESAPSPSVGNAPLADWGTRAMGFIIDVLPIIVLNLLTFWSDFLSYLGGLAGIAYTAYMGYLDGTTGQTPGKAFMGTRLVNEQGEVITAGPGIGRKFVHILDSLICLLGWFLPIVDAKRQTIADKLMQTYVVTGVEKRPLSLELWSPPKTQ